jgi:hypothetical protein
MKLIPKFGVEQLLFGMQQSHVEALYGKPDRNFHDEDGNIIYLYNTQKWRLTFYADEEFKLGYIIVSAQEATLFDHKLLGENVHTVKQFLVEKGLKNWTIENFDSSENHFNEDHWITIQSEFDAIVKIELGAIINQNDAFDWKF